jgi:hypothetical protein
MNFRQAIVISVFAFCSLTQVRAETGISKILPKLRPKPLTLLPKHLPMDVPLSIQHKGDLRDHKSLRAKVNSAQPQKLGLLKKHS